MSFKISYQTSANIPRFEVFGEAANHLDSIARYVRAKVADQKGIVLDIRAMTTRPRADKVFIHVLKYPTVCLRKIALVDLNDNRWFCSLYERLAQKRGYRVRFFGDVEMANEWLLSDDAESKASQGCFGFLGQVVTILRHSAKPARLLDATISSR